MNAELTAWLADRPERGPRRLLFCAGCGRPAARDGVHLLGPGGHVISATAEFPVVLASLAGWDTGGHPRDDGDGDNPRGYHARQLADYSVLIANAPRPLAGMATWTGPFRHGIFYAAAHGPEAPWDSWRADDAWIVVFVTREQVTAAIEAQMAGYGYATLAALEAETGLTAEDAAASLDLPWPAP